MPRLEIPVRTDLRFVRGPTLHPLSALREAESVKIEFDGREFGWLAHPRHGDRKYGPTLTTLVGADTEAAWRRARESAQRLLSALAFVYNTRMASRPSSGGSGEPDLLHPFGSVEVADSAGEHFEVAPTRVIVPSDPQLRLALAVYREGLNAASAFYRFLAFWNVLDVVFDGDEATRDDFLCREAPKLPSRPMPVPADVAAYFRDESRNAIAHIVRRDPTSRAIDPDLPDDRERLDLEGGWIRDLARNAILGRWPKPVSLERPIS